MLEGGEPARKHRPGSNKRYGASLITYFYQKPRTSGTDARSVDETDYIFPWPEPQTKEAGLVMLAGAIEAASKTIPESTPDKIKRRAQKIVNKIFTDGRSDKRSLLLKDLHAITKGFNRVFAGIYRQRVD